MPSIKTTIKIKDNLKGLKALSKRLGASRELIVDVGHFGAKQHSDVTGMTVADVSLVNQLGTKDIPARNYMALALKSPIFLTAYNKAVMRIAFAETTVTRTGRVRSVTIATELPKLGVLLADIMVGVIQSNPWRDQNTQSTIASKGFNHPLIHTQTLLNDISHKLSKDVGRRRDRGLSEVIQ